MMSDFEKSAGATPKYSTPLAGDIILCGASWNVHAQRLLRPGRDADYSHAAVMCGVSHGVQALPESGVDAFSMHEFLSQQATNFQWRVFRRKDLDAHAASGSDTIVTSRFHEAAKYFMGQRYNFGINLPEFPGGADHSQRSFCSQLVARIHEKACGVRPDTRLLTSTVLPADLQFHVTRNFDWLEVTSIYAHRMEWVARNDGLAAAISSDKKSIEILRSGLNLALAAQVRFALDERSLAEVEAEMTSLDAVVDRQFERFTGSRRPPRPALDITGHLSLALERGARSNWQSLRIFERHRWSQRWRAVRRVLKRRFSIK